MYYKKYLLLVSLIFPFLLPALVSAFPVSTTSNVGEVSIAVAGDGNGNFLAAIETGEPNKAMGEILEYNGPIKAVFFNRDGNIINPIDTGRIGCCAVGVAFDGGQYLMVWEDSNGNRNPDYSYQQVYGMFIDTSGNPVGGPFAISEQGIMLKGLSHLAFGSDTGASRYLVIYSEGIWNSYENDYEPGPLYGRFIETNGTVSERFRISDNYGREPSIAYDSSTSKFFVVWVEEPADYPNVIKGRFIALDGTMGDVLTIRQGPSSNAYPNDNPTNVSCAEGKCLVAYTVQQTPDPEKYDPNKWYLYGNIVDATTETVGPQIPIVTKRSQIAPTIGFDGEKWLVAYNDYANDISNFGICDSTEGTCWDIKARYVSTEGTLIGNPFNISAGPGMEFGGIGAYDDTKGFLAIINKCGSMIFGKGCDVYASFLSAPEYYVGLLSPQNGEVIPAGSQYTINWQASPNISRFTLKLSMDNGLTWSIVESNLTGTSYDWTVPVPPNNKKAVLIKIIGYDANNVAVASDKADGTFTIEVVRLDSPNGGETLRSGNTYDITWTTNETKRPVAKVVLSYTKDGGVTWNPITTITGGNPGTYTWTVPTVTTTKTKCKVKVVLKDSAGNVVGSDASNAYFTIQPQ